MTRRALLALLMAPAITAAQPAQRFPQPVLVGTLIGRDVLEPEERQPVLGRVDSVVRNGDSLGMVIAFGGVLGFFSRPILVPIDALALLGEHVAVVGRTGAQLRADPTFNPTGWTPVPPTETIKVGIVRPFH